MNDYKDLEIKEINQEEQRKRKLMENQENKPVDNGLISKCKKRINGIIENIFRD